MAPASVSATEGKGRDVDQLASEITSENTKFVAANQVDLNESALRIKELTGVTDNDDASAARRRAIYNAQENGRTCADCKRAIRSDEPIFRESRCLGRSCFGGHQIPIAPVCLECSSPSTRRQMPRPCGGCGRNVYYERRSYFQRLTFCCEDCHRVARAAANREARRQARGKRACKGCGKSFEPARTDAKFCSNACRQRAYRQRGVTDHASAPRRITISRNGSRPS